MLHNFVNGDIVTPTFLNDLQGQVDYDTTRVGVLQTEVAGGYTLINQNTLDIATLNGEVSANTSNIAINTAAIANINYSDSTYISMYACPSGSPPAPSALYLGKLYYQTHFGMVTIEPQRFDTLHTQQEMYPCYSDTIGNISSYKVQCSNITIPFALGSYSTTKFSTGKNFKIGQYVAFMTNTMTDYATNILGNMNMAIMYGQVTAFTSTPSSITVNITYYRKTSTSGANMVTNGSCYLTSAFPFLVRQSESNDQYAVRAMGIMTSLGGNTMPWWTPEVEFYAWSNPNGSIHYYNPATFFIHNSGPLG